MASVRENLQALLAERANAWETTGKPLADIAAEREFTADESATFERASAAFDAFGQRIRALELTLAQERAVAEFVEELRDDPAVRLAFENELRGILKRESGPVDFAFDGREMNRALGTGTGSNGAGNTIGKTYLTNLIVSLRNFASVLDAGATVITTGGGEQIVIPRIKTFGAGAAATEATQLTGTDPTFDTVTLGAFKFGDYRGVARELIDDSVVDIETLVTTLIGQNIGVLLGQKLATGAGTTEPTGIAVAATVGVTGATGVGGVASFDNLIDLFYSVAAPYRARGSWLIADSALAGIRKLKASGTGEYLWAPSVQVGAPDLILGKPVYGDAYLDAPAVSKVSTVFGDFSGYWVRVVQGLRVERSDQALFGTDQIAFRGIIRADGGLVDPAAVKSFKGGAS